MKTLALVLAVLVLVPVAAEAGKKKKHSTRAHSAQKLKGAQQQAVAHRSKQQAQAALEAERAEAELAEVRSGKVTSQSAADRDFATQQSDDGERPPGFAQR